MMMRSAFGTRAEFSASAQAANTSMMAGLSVTWETRGARTTRVRPMKRWSLASGMAFLFSASLQLPDVVRAVPSAQDAPMMRHALPRLPHSSRALCRAFWMSSRDTIDQLAEESAKAPHEVPKKLISARHCADPHCNRAAATASLRDGWSHAMPHLPSFLS